MAACSKCGTAVPDEARFCPVCGQAITAVEEQPVTVGSVPYQPVTASQPEEPVVQESPLPAEEQQPQAPQQGYYAPQQPQAQAPQQSYYAPQQPQPQAPQQSYYAPQQPQAQAPQQSYYAQPQPQAPQQSYYAQPQMPQQQPSQTPPQQPPQPPQQSYYAQQQTPPQQSYYAQQQTPPQQSYYAQQNGAAPGNNYGYQQNYQQPIPQRQTGPADIEENKGITVLCYLGILLLIPLLSKPNSAYVRYHSNQGLVLLIMSVVLWILFLIPYVGWFVLGPLGSIFIIVCVIMGIINAVGGQMKPLPLVGKITLLK